jgi:DNA (cytosine-5)-methyltransferase 1
MSWSKLSRDEKFAAFKEVLRGCYEEADDIVNGRIPDDLTSRLGDLCKPVISLGSLAHAAPGVILTLAAYKVCDNAQDVTAHKDNFIGGFSARAYDSRVTVPFLTSKDLPRSVESHWLTQTFSFSPEFRAGLELKTQPKVAGPLVVQVVTAIQAEPTGKLARDVVVAIFVEKIKIRNKSKVTLTRPKGLSIDRSIFLIQCHFTKKYSRNAPRLPQLALYAVYQCLLHQVVRYQGCKLDPIERLKSADRKANTVGDVVVSKDGTPFEGVEIKFQLQVTFGHVCEAIEKVRALSVRRYYILSTNGVVADEAAAIELKRAEFLKQNGCEIIVNGVLQTLAYYLRLLPDTTEFVFNYAGLVESDADTDYEHRIAWNDCCQSM